MEKESCNKTGKVVSVAFLSLTLIICLGITGCNPSGYSNEQIYPVDVKSVYLEMFDNQSFRRDIEYELSDALGKRIEADTPYKIVTSRDRADTILSGQITSADQSTLTIEREIGRALEKDVQLSALVTWKNLKTGELLIDRETVTAAASYSEWQNQGFDYGAALAANKLAQRIVELMEKKW